MAATRGGDGEKGMREQGVVQGGAGVAEFEAGCGRSRPAIGERDTGVVNGRVDWTSVRCKVGQEVRGSRRAVVTAGQRSGDVAGLSEVQGINTVASGRVSVTVQGTSMGQGRPLCAYCMVPLALSGEQTLSRKEIEQVIVAVGSRVRIKELKTRPDCNGLEGTVKALLPDERLWVVLDDGGELNVSEAIIIAVGSRVRIKELKTRPECNGLEGTVKALLPDERLWVVLDNGEELNVSAGKAVLIDRNSNVRGTQNTVGAEENTGRGRRKMLETAGEEELEKLLSDVEYLLKDRGAEAKRKQTIAVGSRVQIEGLISRPECNGLEGTVRALLPDERLWVVLDDGGELNVSFGKTVLVDRDVYVRAEPLLIELEEADTVW
jgi:translation initiation factor IF-1